MLSSIRIPSDLEVDTCFIGTLSIESSMDSDNVLSFLSRTNKHKLGFSRIQNKSVAEKQFVDFA